MFKSKGKKEGFLEKGWFRAWAAKRKGQSQTVRAGERPPPSMSRIVWKGNRSDRAGTSTGPHCEAGNTAASVRVPECVVAFGDSQSLGKQKSKSTNLFVNSTWNSHSTNTFLCKDVKGRKISIILPFWCKVSKESITRLVNMCLSYILLYIIYLI